MALTKVTSGGISDIAAAVEGASDSNKFTDADHSKLNAIEASATADQTKSDIEGLGIDVPAANLTGTIADARFPATLPTASAANLTAIPAANITGTLPAISGANLTGLSSFNPDGAVTINESGAAVDFRVETDSNANMLFVDGSTNRIGIGTATPQDSLHLAGHNLAISEGEEIKWIDSSGNKSGRIYTTSSDDMYFDVTSSNTNRLKILSSGDVRSVTNASFWVRFDGGGTPGIADSHNVSSIGDWDTGNYGIYISASLTNANYAISGCGRSARILSLCTDHTAPTTGRCDVYLHTHSGSSTDDGYVYVIGIGGR